MKLFQHMLVATASLGLISPIAAQASDVLNLEGMTNYNRSQKKSSSKRFDNKTFVNEVNNDLATLDNGVLAQDNFDAGVFSDTTVMDAKVIFTTGLVETEDDVHDGQLNAFYTYQMNLNTSFDGDDNLYIRLKTGNHDVWSDVKSSYNTYLSAGTGKGDALEVDKIWYTKPINDEHTIYIGPKIENYYMHATTPSLYKPVLKSFTLGGNAAAYGASTSPGAGWAYKNDNGLGISTNFTSQGGNGANGMLTEESPSSWATQIGYTKPNYSFSAILNSKSNGWVDEYFQTDAGDIRPGNGNSTNIGLRAWLRPDETGTFKPSVSLGYDTSSTDAAGDANTTNAYFVGLNWQDIFSADDRIGIAFGQPQKHEDDIIEPSLYEVYYSFKVNDSMSVTPALFGGRSNEGDVEVDMTGYVINTEFKF